MQQIIVKVSPPTDASRQSVGHEHPARLLRTRMGVESVSGPCKQAICWARAPSPAFAHADGRGVCLRPMQACNLLGTSTQPGFCARGWAWSLSQAHASMQSVGHEHPARLLRTRMGLGWDLAQPVRIPSLLDYGLRESRPPVLIILQSFHTHVMLMSQL
jgi:hypothetical protein